MVSRALFKPDKMVAAVHIVKEMYPHIFQPNVTDNLPYSFSGELKHINYTRSRNGNYLSDSKADELSRIKFSFLVGLTKVVPLMYRLSKLVLPIAYIRMLKLI